MNDHLKNACEENLVVCEMRRFGCKFNEAHYKWAKHCAECSFCQPEVRSVLCRQEGQMQTMQTQIQTLLSTAAAAKHQFFVRLEGRSVVLQVDANSTVADATDYAVLKCGMDTSARDLSYLIHGGRILDRCAILSECAPRDSTLECRQRVVNDRQVPMKRKRDGDGDDAHDDDDDDDEDDADADDDDDDDDGYDDDDDDGDDGDVDDDDR